MRTRSSGWGGALGWCAARLWTVKRRLPATAPAHRPLVRRALAVGVGLGVTLLASGCQVLSPKQTQMPYIPADGTPATVGQLAIRDLVLVGDGSGPVVLSGSAVNLGTQPMTVQLVPQPSGTDTSTAPPSGGSELQLGPREQVSLATKSLQFNDTGAKPGGLVPVSITSSTGGTTIISVPVLPPTEYYSTLTPTPAPTTTSATTSAPTTPAATATTTN
ncbi:MAG: putative lipoprotein [Humibacillus sp.]|nr:putative lipoprotein [Humibacillus sp.]